MDSKPSDKFALCLLHKNFFLQWLAGCLSQKQVIRIGVTSKRVLVYPHLPTRHLTFQIPVAIQCVVFDTRNLKVIQKYSNVDILKTR